MRILPILFIDNAEHIKKTEIVTPLKKRMTKSWIFDTPPLIISILWHVFTKQFFNLFKPHKAIFYNSHNIIITKVFQQFNPLFQRIRWHFIIKISFSATISFPSSGLFLRFWEPFYYLLHKFIKPRIIQFGTDWNH